MGAVRPEEGGRLATGTLSAFKDKVARIASTRDFGVALDFREPRGDLIDSANAVPADWLRVRDCLEEVWDAYDGFVVVHGKDTIRDRLAMTLTQGPCLDRGFSA